MSALTHGSHPNNSHRPVNTVTNSTKKTLIEFFLRCRNNHVGISVIVAHLTVRSYRSRQFPTVLVPGHVHRNKLISLLNREEQQEPRKRRQRIFFFFYWLEEESGFDSQREEWREGARQTRETSGVT